MHRIAFGLAVNSILILLSLVIGFHLLILSGMIPYDMVWGGRLTSQEQMIKYELSSIFINVCMLLIVAMKGRRVKPVLPDRILTIFLWLFVLVFALNTLGNLMAFNSLETYIFTPVTFILVILFSRVAIEKNHS